MTESSKLHNNHTFPETSSGLGNVEPRTTSASRLYPKPLITVIIPVYNVAKVLERCVKSISSQTYHNLEIILVDDGSTDMSGKFCDVFAKKDSRIKVIHQSNQGLSAARNAGLDLATGQYITFVDSDDVAHPDLITTLYQLLQDHQTAISIGSFTEVYPNGRRQNFVEPQPSSQDASVLSTVECLTAMLCENGFTMSACSKLYARELFGHVRFPVGKLHEDVGTTYKLIEQCDKIAITSISLYDYYQNDNSIIHQNFTKRKLDLVELTDQMCDELTAKFLTPDSDNHTLDSGNYTSAQNPNLTGNESSSKNHTLASQNLTNLSNALKKRRMHARFSILRQMVMVKPRAVTLAQNNLTPSEFRKIRRRTTRYLRKHKNYILKNPLSTRRDILAMRSLQLGLPFFKFAWQAYLKNRQKSPKKA